ncbi:MAG: relaxase/mobilization nuclease domain-containing protein [Rhodothermales bacterium]
MIGKVSSGTSFSGLATYLTQSEERVAWTEPRWMIGTDPQEVAREMETAASLSDARLEKPVYHISISFSETDQPTREQMQQAADRVLGELGLGEHQALLVAHEDKGHPHLHVMANRVHPDTGKAATVSFDYRRVESVLRELEKEWGLTRVPGHHARDAGDSAPDRTRGLSTGEVRRVRRTGELPFPEQVREKMGDDLGRTLGSAKGWSEVHEALGRRGYRLEPTERGMVVTDGERYAKASSVDERLSRPRLEARFGQTLDAHDGEHQLRQPGAEKAMSPEVYKQLFGAPALAPSKAEHAASPEPMESAGSSGIARAAQVRAVTNATLSAIDGEADEREVPTRTIEAGVLTASRLSRGPESKDQIQGEAPSVESPPSPSPAVRELAGEVRAYERVAGVEQRLGLAVQDHAELEGQLRSTGRQGQEATRLSDTFDRALGEAYRDPAAARRSFEALAAQEGPEAAARTMRRTPEQFGPVVATEHSKWMGLAREVSRAEGYEAARSAANVGEQYVHTRAFVGGTGHEALRTSLASKGREVQSLQQELTQLTSRHGQPTQILERIGQRAQVLTTAQTNHLGRTLSPPQMAVVSKAAGLAAKVAKGVER